MMSDVPYGAFLSGGLDSTAIVQAMKRKADEPPLTFTIGFPGAGAELDERSAAEQTAAAIGTRHHATAMEQGDFTAELDACVRHLEEPTGAASAPAAFQLSRFAAESVKVVLSGQGADEPLGGYERHQAGAMLGLIARVPSALARPLVAAAENIPRNERLKRATRLLGPDDDLDRVLQIFEIADVDTRGRLTSGPAAAAADERRALAADVLADLGDTRDALSQVLYLDTHMFLPDSLLLYGDKTSMAASLEQRVPFLDVELMRFIERIPARTRVRGLKRKWLYRKALEGRLVPDSVMNRKKHPFATPYDDWFRSSLSDELDRLYTPSSPIAEHIDPTEVHRLTDDHRRGRADHKRILYCLLEFAYWHRAFIEKAPRPEIQPAWSVDRWRRQPDATIDEGGELGATADQQSASGGARSAGVHGRATCSAIIPAASGSPGETATQASCSRAKSVRASSRSVSVTAIRGIGSVRYWIALLGSSSPSSLPSTRAASNSPVRATTSDHGIAS